MKIGKAFGMRARSPAFAESAEIRQRTIKTKTRQITRKRLITAAVLSHTMHEDHGTRGIVFGGLPSIK